MLSHLGFNITLSRIQNLMLAKTRNRNIKYEQHFDYLWVRCEHELTPLSKLVVQEGHTSMINMFKTQCNLPT